MKTSLDGNSQPPQLDTGRQRLFLVARKEKSLIYHLPFSIYDSFYEH